MPRRLTPTAWIGEANSDAAEPGVAGRPRRAHHRRDRLHWGTTGVPPRRRGCPASLSRPSPGRARVARVADDGSGRRRSSRSRVTRSRPRRNRRGLLLRALHRRTGRLPRTGSRGRPQLWRRRTAGGGSAHRVPRGARRRQRCAQQASQEPSRDGRGAASQRGADRGIPCLGRDRIGQPLVRADPRTGRSSAGDDLPTVGVDVGAADRRGRRARVSGICT